MSPFARLLQFELPEYRDRHVFTGKLRLGIFIGFWFLYVFFLDEPSFDTTLVSAIILFLFFVIGLCFYHMISNKHILAALVTEKIADVIMITIVVYLTGGSSSPYFMIYALYCMSTGLFYNYYLAFFCAVLSFVAYILFFLTIKLEWIMSPPVNLGRYDIESVWAHPLLLILFLVFTVYATKIAHYFTLNRERELVIRNKELVALYQIGATVRGSRTLAEVIDSILRNVIAGLDFRICLLLRFDPKSQSIRCHGPTWDPIMKRIEYILGVNLQNLHLDAATFNYAAFQTIQKKQVTYRRSLSEMLSGTDAHISMEKADHIQALLGSQKIVVIPLIVEDAVMGALAGFSSKSYIDDTTIRTFEAFANQAALAVQTTQLIEELRSKNRELQEANRVKSEFLATMSHELRTPLTAIIGFSELLLENVMGELNPEQCESLTEVLHNGNSLLELINNLLDLSKMDSGKMTLRFEAFDLNELTERLIRTLSSLIQKKRLQVNVGRSDPLPPMVGDEKRIHQIILNLLSNAIKFTEESGKISITLHYYHDYSKLPMNYQAKIRPVGKSGFFYMGVLDNGIGVPPQYVSSIFDMFTQIESSTTRRYAGTGLGLSLAKQLVELHRGVIWVESEYGKGSNFQCIIPEMGGGV